MAPPSKLAVATSSLVRLVKEEASYHKEMAQQEARIKKLEGDSTDENAEYQLRQERQGLEETKNVLPSMQQKIQEALARLEQELESNKDSGGEQDSEQVTKANNAVSDAKKVISEGS
ncbi:tubulin binding cofactor A [Lophium mytilinum]|uniref:Tubulin-specific chaperone A n=1 Tax=Lophium mytilinum TaxID=390894 RepID=A0A6A6QPT6_9PEZI|nr:tubulin binding cofactor A [Lophium mytilinum]